MAGGVDGLIRFWVALPELARLLGEPENRLRQWLREGRLAALRRGQPPQWQVPAEFVSGGALIRGLPGTLVVLRDAGYTVEEALRWLFTADASLPGRPIDALVQGRGGEVRRRAQASAL